MDERGQTPRIGKTIQRLRQAYRMSLGALSDASGVSKSIISQIERNETNPTLATVWRLAQALDSSIEEVLRTERRAGLMDVMESWKTPVVLSEDGLCRLRIIGMVGTVEWLQWYIFEAEPGGVLESEPHQVGAVENLTLLRGRVEILVGDEVVTGGQGQTLRYRGDVPHRIANAGEEMVEAVMVNVMKAAVLA